MLELNRVERDLQERKALYYPWIHFHSDEWVKKSLLIFPGITRIVPIFDSPNDSRLVEELSQEGLIRRANISSRGVYDAQEQLLQLMREDFSKSPLEIEANFGRDATTKSGLPPFQMQLDRKANWELVKFLQDSGLAWGPNNPQREGYSELHPRVGHAVMGTLALACAKDAGLHIVGANSPRGLDMSGELNDLLGSSDTGGPYKHFVRNSLNTSDRTIPKTIQLLQVLIDISCDVSQLDAQSIVKLQSEREPMRALKRAVREFAQEIPDMADVDIQKQAFREKSHEILMKWRQDRANLSGFARRVFKLDHIGGAAGKTLEACTPLLTGAATVVASGVTAGLAIGILTHLGVAYRDMKKTEEDSPLRFLTLAEGKGATFTVNSNRSGNA